MSQYKGENTFGCRRKASYKLAPSLISWWIVSRILRSPGCSVCSSKIFNRDNIGTPARIKVLNCLVKRISSDVLTGEKKIEDGPPLRTRPCRSFFPHLRWNISLGGQQTAGFSNGVGFNFAGGRGTGIPNGAVTENCHFNPLMIGDML
jgi:hypothetical protein